MKSMGEILETEVSEKFIQGMKSRMIVSYHKYGPVRDAYPSKVDAVASMEQRVEKYRETGNTEHLIDAANFLMIEFMHPGKPGAHFRATDSDESPGRVNVSGATTWKANDDIPGETS